MMAEKQLAWICYEEITSLAPCVLRLPTLRIPANPLVTAQSAGTLVWTMEPCIETLVYRSPWFAQSIY